LYSSFTLSCTSFLVARRFTGPKNIFRKAPANPTEVQDIIINKTQASPPKTKKEDKTQEQDERSLKQLKSPCVLLGSSAATSPSAMRHVARSKSSSTGQNHSPHQHEQNHAHCDDQSAAGTENDAAIQEPKELQEFVPSQTPGLHTQPHWRYESWHFYSRPNRSSAEADLPGDPAPPTGPETQHAEPSQRRAEP